MGVVKSYRFSTVPGISPLNPHVVQGSTVYPLGVYVYVYVCVCVYTYVYIYTYMCVYIYVYVYIYIKRTNKTTTAAFSQVTLLRKT